MVAASGRESDQYYLGLLALELLAANRRLAVVYWPSRPAGSSSGFSRIRGDGSGTGRTPSLAWRGSSRAPCGGGRMSNRWPGIADIVRFLGVEGRTAAGRIQSKRWSRRNAIVTAMASRGSIGF